MVSCSFLTPVGPAFFFLFGLDWISGALSARTELQQTAQTVAHCSRPSPLAAHWLHGQRGDKEHFWRESSECQPPSWFAAHSIAARFQPVPSAPFRLSAGSFQFLHISMWTNQAGFSLSILVNWPENSALCMLWHMIGTTLKCKNGKRSKLELCSTQGDRRCTKSRNTYYIRAINVTEEANQT